MFLRIIFVYLGSNTGGRVYSFGMHCGSRSLHSTKFWFCVTAIQSGSVTMDMDVEVVTLPAKSSSEALVAIIYPRIMIQQFWVIWLPLTDHKTRQACMAC